MATDNDRPVPKTLKGGMKKAYSQPPRNSSNVQRASGAAVNKSAPATKPGKGTRGTGKRAR